MVRVFEAFAGVGSQRMALRNIGLDHEVVAISEIDTHAIKAYMEIHGSTPNLGDISKVGLDDIPDHDLFTYSFPCTDVSISGERKGMSEGSGTSSSLLWECKRVIAGKRPKYLLLENVKNLVGKQNVENFHRWLGWLDSMGYRSFWKVINATQFGIPQNRERVFVVSVLEGTFEFPTGTPCTVSLKDILEEEVDEKYFLSQMVQDRFVYKPQGTDIIVMGSTIGEDCTRQGQRDRVYSSDGYMATLGASDYKQPKQIIVEGRIEGVGTYKHDQSKRVYNPDGLAPTVHTSGGGGQHIKIMGDRIRRLSPREYWRLMGFLDSDFDRVRPIMSDTQLYKQAGNSIVVPVLEAIFKNIF